MIIDASDPGLCTFWIWDVTGPFCYETCLRFGLVMDFHKYRLRREPSIAASLKEPGYDA